MKCLQCNLLVFGDATIADCQNKGHVILTIEKATDFYMIANELNLLNAEMKHKIINGGGSIEW